MNRAHRVILTVSDGRVLGRPLGMPVVELHTVGGRSVSSRSCYLTTPMHDDRRSVLVDAHGGDDRHPEWYWNLMASPEAEINMQNRWIPIRARTASLDEEARLWPRIVRAYRGYAA